MKSSDSKAANVVDALVKLTVRSVLFPGLKGTKGSPSRSTAKPPLVDKRAEEPQAEAGDGPSRSFISGDHYAHVLSYASWSDTQLDEEKQRLRQWLKIRLEKRAQEPTNPEEEEEEEENAEGDGGSKTECHTEQSEAAMLEAYALLTLFQSERAFAPDTLSAVQPPSPGLLHAQLDLYAKYFEKTQRRKIQHEVDVLPIQKMYQSFVQSTSQQYDTSSTAIA